MMHGINKNTKIAYDAVFNTDDGQIVLQDLAKFCHLMQPAFNGTTEGLLISEGERNVMLYILKVLERQDLQTFTKISEGVKQDG